MQTILGRRLAVPAIAFVGPVLMLPGAARADEAERPGTPEIVVTGHHADDRIDLPPATRITLDAERIAATVNSASVEDTLKYAPSLVIRKRHIGDNFAPIATRTSGLGASARSLIYADGVLLSAFIANNNGNGSPRWTLVAPEEISRIDVLYGPFSAAYPGNGIGTTVNITTRMPDRLAASARVLTNVQEFSLYGTTQTLPTYQAAMTLGGKIGPLALFGAFTRTDAESQPVSIVTAPGTGNPTDNTGATVTGGYSGQNRSGAAIRVLGAGGIEHHVQDTAKLKAALDLGGNARVSYLLGRWTDDTRSAVQSYLARPDGTAAYTSAFNSGLYRRDARHTAHALTLEGSSQRFDWHVVGTSYRYDRDRQSGPTAANALPGALSGGAGQVQRQDGSGWVTLDAKVAWRPLGNDAHVVSLGLHADRYTLNSQTFAATDWQDNAAQGAVIAASRGRARTLAVWGQDTLALSRAFTLTLGARQEWWRAWNGFNQAGATVLNQQERRFQGFSPKAALAWNAARHWTVRLSLAQAWRFPTVGELYQVTTIGSNLANPNPGLRPERARAAELALEHHSDNGTLRASLFNEVIDGALISQTNIADPLVTSSYVQNVDRTRARGIELVLDRRNVMPRVDVSASVTYSDAITSRNAAFPAAVGRLLPSVPRWKANAVLSWRADDAITLTTAARFASRNYATLDNSDPVGNTYQGFYKYFVVDARARFAVNRHFEFAVGVDNLNNARYFLFHPFPQRSVTAEIRWTY
ncbi:MAG: TonB-dependent receptor [Pseudomonadota bacterium]